MAPRTRPAPLHPQTPLWEGRHIPLSRRLRKFEEKCPPSRLLAKKLRDEFRGFSKYLLKENLLARGERGFKVLDYAQARAFCSENVLPMVTRLSEDGICVVASFESNLLRISDIFHTASMGGPTRYVNNLPISPCPVFFGASTTFSQILESGPALPSHLGLGLHVKHGGCSEERICIFSDLIRKKTRRRLARLFSPPPAPQKYSLGGACNFLKNNAYFSAKEMGADRVFDLKAYDSLLHEGAHSELHRWGEFPRDFHELFAYSLSIANAKLPHIQLSLISGACAHRHGNKEHIIATEKFLSMLSAFIPRDGQHNLSLPRMIAGFASRSPEEIREAARKVLSRICARHSIGVGSMQEKIVRDAQKAVFG